MGTRNVVETAIDISKLDHKTTWQRAVAANMPNSIRPWEAFVKPQGVETSEQ